MKELKLQKKKSGKEKKYEEVSFSVAKGVGIFLPFQLNDVAIIASVKSALGSQSVQFLCPWKPPTMAL